MSDKYNGWSNYETWVVDLWLTNDKDSYDCLTQEAQVHYNDAQTGPHLTREQIATHKLSVSLELMLEKCAPELSGVYGDLLSHALRKVDWLELAGSWIEEVNKEVQS